MARRSNPGRKDLMPLLVVGGALFAGASGLLGATVKAAFGQIGADIRGTIGGGTPPVGGLTVTTQPARTGADPGTMSSASAIYAAAQAAGVTDPNNPAAIPYGRALWALSHGGDPSGYNGQSQAIQSNWNAVAIHGG